MIELDYSEVNFDQMLFEQDVDIENIRDSGYLKHQDLVDIVDNKSGGRATSTAQDSKFNRLNVEKISWEAFQLVEENKVRAALSHLTLLEGVRARTASAILVSYSDDFGMIDRKAVENLQLRGIMKDFKFSQDEDWIRYYPYYLEKLEEIRDSNSDFESVREVEFALYQQL